MALVARWRCLTVDSAVHGLRRQGLSRFLEISLLDQRLNAMGERRDIGDPPDPLLDIKPHGFRPEADLDRAVGQGIVMQA